MNSSSVLQYIHAFSPSRRLALVIGATAVAACTVQALPAGLAEGVNREDGLFEILSAVLLAVAAVLGVYHAWRRPGLARAAGAVLLVALLLRELDFQKRFTYRSIESIGFYTRPIAPWTEKAAGLAVLSVIAVAVGVLAWAAWRRLGEALQAKQPWPGTLTSAGLLLVAGLASEKVLGFTLAEEVFEAGFAAIVLIMAWDAGRGALALAPQAAQPAPAPVLSFAAETAANGRGGDETTNPSAPRRAA